MEAGGRGGSLLQEDAGRLWRDTPLHLTSARPAAVGWRGDLTL